ncbi:MAG: hypothetical protein TE42_09005 [Candidatus Synechococcus spongiarum SP3]|uniref:Uncharacterized protein n=1 Tax=Candidatus Synechococcus spongiarum SP3 TaxID=1604020 RepID=A0A0G2IVN0_9SYNE|nr:MAG: hypothetical protein TE42_09005 [Candidatus Synechococcus spongiarum SP3]
MCFVIQTEKRDAARKVVLCGFTSAKGNGTVTNLKQGAPKNRTTFPLGYILTMRTSVIEAVRMGEQAC